MLPAGQVNMTHYFKINPKSPLLFILSCDAEDAENASVQECTNPISIIEQYKSCESNSPCTLDVEGRLIQIKKENEIINENEYIGPEIYSNYEIASELAVNHENDTIAVCYWIEVMLGGHRSHASRAEVSCRDIEEEYDFDTRSCENMISSPSFHGSNISCISGSPDEILDMIDEIKVKHVVMAISTDTSSDISLRILDIYSRMDAGVLIMDTYGPPFSRSASIFDKIYSDYEFSEKTLPTPTKLLEHLSSPYNFNERCSTKNKLKIIMTLPAQTGLFKRFRKNLSCETCYSYESGTTFTGSYFLGGHSGQKIAVGETTNSIRDGDIDACIEFKTSRMYLEMDEDISAKYDGWLHYEAIITEVQR